MRIPAGVVVLSVLAGGSPAAAQDAHVGLKAGVNVATLALVSEEPSDDYGRRAALAAGGFAVLPVAGRLRLQIETLFSARGAKIDDEELGATATLLLDYIDVPVLARVNGPRDGAFHVFGGPYVGMRIGARRQIAAAVPGFTSGTREDIGDEIERFELGMVAGAGIQRGRRLVVDARYAWGLTNVNSDTTTGLRFRSRVLTFLAGFRF